MYCFARSEYIDNLLLALNCFHENIKSKIETDKGNTIPFLDILKLGKLGKIEARVCRKKTCTDLYMNWYSFATKRWKWGTLKTLVRRAHVTCSTDKHLKDKLKHIKKTFNEIINYWHCVIAKVFKEMTSSGTENQVEEGKNTS